MKDIFITEIDVKQIRHLNGIKIPLSDKSRKHLILTGKNGSGKTSILEVLKESFQYESTSMFDSAMIPKKHKNFGLDIKFNIKDKEELDKIFFDNNFILCFFDAKRSRMPMNIPNGITKITTKQKYKILDNANKDFIQFLVNLKADRSFARDEEDTETVEKIDKWFDTFIELLGEIFEDKELELAFDKAEYNFYILQKNKKPFGLSSLSDGYSAILDIITELMMRMDKYKSKIYDLQGIVLIDEIETHLHIDLQKKVMPFLIKIFPNIQFIVSTHSPFVLNSISNAVIYDLEKNIRAEDFSAFAYDSIVETYFDNDKYSEITKIRLERFKQLLFSKTLTNEEKNELRKIEYYFDNIPSFVAPELISVYQNLQLQKQNFNG